jgi:hypothetical protein
MTLHLAQGSHHPRIECATPGIARRIARHLRNLVDHACAARFNTFSGDGIHIRSRTCADHADHAGAHYGNGTAMQGCGTK